jgi:AraC family transcriptional regulator
MDFLSQQSLLAFSMEEAADTAGMSPYYFIRRFRQFTGKTPYNYYMDCKMERARQLLSDKRKSITEVAEETGFSSASHFSTIFKRATGMTPSKYRSSSC